MKKIAIDLENGNVAGTQSTIHHRRTTICNAAAGALLAAQAAHKDRIVGVTRVSDYAPIRGRQVPSIEFDPESGHKIEPERTRIRVVRPTEQEAPAVRGRVHGKFGS